MEELVATEFFGFVPEQLYQEVYAIGYNEFLAAVSSLRDTLLQEFPEKEAEVDRGCSALLASYGKAFDREWFTKFLQYCGKNIFVVPRHVPVYHEDFGREDSQDAVTKVEELRHRIMATEYLNAQLQARIQETDREIERRRALLQEVKRTEARLSIVEKAKELERQLREVAGNLFGEEELS